jgi:hypothetical protein
MRKKQDAFVVIGWPEVERLTGMKGFAENSYIVNDNRGMEEFGNNAYFVSEKWLKKVEEKNHPVKKETVPESIARRIFEKKQKANYYLVSGEILYLDASSPGEDGSYPVDNSEEGAFYIPLEDKEVGLLRELLDDPEYEHTLEELKDRIPFYDKLIADVSDLGPMVTFEPKGIDTEKAVHFYEFTVVKMGGVATQPKLMHVNITIPDDDYLFLLGWKLKFPGESFNALSLVDPDLYAELTRRLISVSGMTFLDAEVTAPFLVFMDELEKDIKNK